jgi:hypothetical protein
MQIVSDLHLEFYRNPLDLKLKVTSPYLALLGDICVAGTNDIKNLEKFLDYYSANLYLGVEMFTSHIKSTLSVHTFDVTQHKG